MAAFCVTEVAVFGEKSAIRKYRRKLSLELSQRYSISGPYTQAQVDTTIRDLRLSKKHVQYAYLMFCEQEVWGQEKLSESTIDRMQETIAAAVGGGIAAMPIDTLFGGSDGDGGGFGDGGGGGDG